MIDEATRRALGPSLLAVLQSYRKRGIVTNQFMSMYMMRHGEEILSGARKEFRLLRGVEA
jgi:hypothetical protein